MTRKEFLKRLAAKASLDWDVNIGGKLRAVVKGRKTCPIKAVAGETGELISERLLRSLKLRHDLADVIIDAADYQSSDLDNFVRRLRNDMLRAVGLPRTRA